MEKDLKRATIGYTLMQQVLHRKGNSKLILKRYQFLLSMTVNNRITNFRQLLPLMSILTINLLMRMTNFINPMTQISCQTEIYLYTIMEMIGLYHQKICIQDVLNIKLTMITKLCKLFGNINSINFALQLDRVEE
jgi:hypothetical protein